MTAITSRTFATPLAHRISMLPLLMDRALRRFCSSISPSTNPRINGDIGKCILRKMYPSTPRPTISTRSKVVLWTAYTPTAETAAMAGTRNHSGMVSMRVNRPINGMFMTSSITFAISSAAISPQTISGCSVNIAGPGVMLYSVSAPIMTAVVPEPGTPSVSIGINEPQAEALLAASGAATPRMSPFPKLSLLPLSFFSVM